MTTLTLGHAVATQLYRLIDILFILAARSQFFFVARCSDTRSYPLVMSNIAIEHCHLYWIDPIKNCDFS